MPPRRDNSEDSNENYNLGDIMRELQRMNQRLEAVEDRTRGPPSDRTHGPPSPRHGQEPFEEEEEGNPFHQEGIQEEGPRQNRFRGRFYQRHRAPPMRRSASPPAGRMPFRPYDYGVKIDLPEFDGRLDPDEFLDWLQAVERACEYKEIPGDRRVSLVALKLRKSASLWWENLMRSRTREGRGRITTWEKMRRELTRKYLPAHYRQEVFLRLHGLQQREMTVEAYTSEFERLMLKTDLTEPEEHTVARFLGGLRPAISNVVQLQPYWTLIDVQTLAYKVERQQKSTRPFLPSRPLPPPQPPATVLPMAAPAATARAVAQDVRAVDSRRVEAGNTSTLPPARRCFRCQGFGHIASTCPTRNLLTFSEHGEVFEQTAEPEAEEAKEPEGEVCHLQADEGELLVVRRVLTATVSRDESWLRRNIFRTRCTVQGKVCSLIVDGGSCENVASANMVKRLGLHTEKHPQPYALTWLNQKSEVHVTKRCLINLSIGTTLQEQVWCDVVPMDACHILLGRPWQYDRRTEHDGMKNTYSFIQGEKKIVLLPWKEEGEDSSLLIFRSPLPVQETPHVTDRAPLLIGFAFDEAEASLPGENDTVVREPDPEEETPVQAGPELPGPELIGPVF